MAAVRELMRFSILAYLAACVYGQQSVSKQQTKWISQIFNEAEQLFDVAPNVSLECDRDMQSYKLHLQNQTVWAVRILESSGWPSVGLLAGITYSMGNWDECLRARGPNNLKGQYCLIQNKLNFTMSATTTGLQPAWIKWPDENASSWDVISKYEEDPIRISRLVYTWALCAPSSCGIADLKKSLNHTLHAVFQKYGVDISVNIHPAACKVDEEYIRPNGFYYTIITFIVLIFLVICTTIFDKTRDETSAKAENRWPVQFLLCFSAMQSYKRLTYFSSTSTYAPLNFAKIVCIIAVIYGHRLFLMYGFPAFHSEQIEMTYIATNVQLVETDVVDIFFLMTGFLTFHFGLTPMKQGGVVYLVFSLIFRWIRLIPTFGVVMLYFIFILPYTSDGPLWNVYKTKRIGHCYKNWWTNLLTVNNIVNPHEPCIPINWYIAVDMQLTILGSLLLLVITKRKKAGYFLTLFVFLFSAFLTYLTVYMRNYYGLPRWFMKSLEDPIPLEEYWNFYIKSYTRVGPYLMGFATAAAVQELNKRKIKFSGLQSTVIITLSIIIGLGFQFYGMFFFQTGRPYDPVENGIYAALHRTLFVLPVACLVGIYFVSGLGILNVILHWKLYLPFGRLTYCVLLTSYVLQMYHILSQRSYLPLIRGQNTLWWAGSDILYSFILAFFLYLISEGPLSNFSKLLQKYLVEKFIEPHAQKYGEKGSEIQSAQ